MGTCNFRLVRYGTFKQVLVFRVISEVLEMKSLIFVTIIFVISFLFGKCWSQFQTGGDFVIPPDRPSNRLQNRARNSANRRLIFNNLCDRPRWQIVRKDRNECPLVFEDRTLTTFQDICENDSWASLFPRYQIGEMFTWLGGRRHRQFPFRYCRNVPICLACPALNNCPRGGRKFDEDEDDLLDLVPTEFYEHS